MARDKQITFDNIAFTIDSSKFYDMQNILIGGCGLTWRGRENSPEFKETYANLKNLYGKGFIIIFLNERTFDVMHERDRTKIGYSGRSVVDIKLSLKNFPKSDDRRKTLLMRLQTEYNEQYLNEKPNLSPLTAVMKMPYITVDDIEDGPMEKKKKKLKKSNLSNTGDYYFIDDDAVNIKESSRNVGNTTKFMELESMLLISSNKN